MNLPLIQALSACARDSAERGEPFHTFSGTEGEAMAAFARRILPSEDGPGAEEAGAVHFVDQALASHFADALPLIRSGLADLDERARQAPGDAETFAELSADEQVRIMEEVEDTPFFFMARMFTVMGTFADPRYGGGRGGVGWEILGIDHRPAFEPPFGWYDAAEAE